MNIIKYLTNWKYRYFIKKYHAIDCMIQDFEFKRFKTRDKREEIRNAFDQSKAKLQSIETTIKHEEEKTDNKMPEGDLARLKDEVIRLNQLVESYLAQLKSTDVEIEGSPQTNEYPEGVDGITQQLEALHEVKGMVKEYAKNL